MEMKNTTVFMITLLYYHVSVYTPPEQRPSDMTAKDEERPVSSSHLFPS
jgi:hypothetical protein